MKTVILAGGLGTRLSEETRVKPKPMVEIGNRPILWHIMKTYAHYGHTDFIIALGYKGEIIKEFFLNYYYLNNDLTLNLGSGKIQVHTQDRDSWTVSLIDTGSETQTGGRLKRLKEHLGNETFMMTYGDGVSNVNIDRLLNFHKSHGKLTTITAVRPPARFGSLRFSGDMITAFEEKPVLGEGWINGGFFVLEPQVLEYIDGDSCVWERGPLENLATEGQLMAYKHDEYWQCMDTMRDVKKLNEEWDSGNAPWKVWDQPAYIR